MFVGSVPEANAQLYANVGETTDNFPDLYRFNAADSTWSSRGFTPSIIYTKPSFLFTDGMNLYAIGEQSRKRSVQGLFRYTTTTGNWTSLADVSAIYSMVGLVSSTAGARLYGYRGCGGCPIGLVDLMRYDANTNILTTLFSSISASTLVSSGTDLYTLDSTSLRVLDGANTAFLPRTNAPGPVSKFATGTADYLYVVSMANQIYRYSIATNNWITLPGIVPAGTGDLTTDGGRLYLRRARSVYSYDLATGIWSAMPILPQNIYGGDGGNLVYVANPCPPTRCVPLVVSRLR